MLQYDKQVKQYDYASIKGLSLPDQIKHIDKAVQQALLSDNALLFISMHNSKIKALGQHLGRIAGTLDTLAGHTCPAADICKGQVNLSTGKIDKGINSAFLCYAAKLQAVYRQYLLNCYFNMRLIDLSTDVTGLLIKSIQAANVQVLRIHSAGDYDKLSYFNSMIDTAKALPDVSFFGYTKMLPFIKQYRAAGHMHNFRLQYSIGSRYDNQYYADTAAGIEIPACYVLPKGQIIYTDNDTDKGSIDRHYTYVKRPDYTELIRVQVNKYDDYHFIRSGLTFGIPVH